MKTLTSTTNKTFAARIIKTSLSGLALTLTLSACDGEEATPTELTQAEALMSASDIATEELELQELALSVDEITAEGGICTPRRIVARGRAHHAQRAERERFEGERPERPEGERPEGARPEGEDRERGSRRGRRRLTRDLLVRLAYDADSDGALGEEERAELTADLVAGCEARHARVLEEFDADEDGTLSDDELEVARAAFEERREAREEQRAAEREAREAEREARREEARAELDVDGDGELSREERRAAHEQRREERRAEMIAEFDADGDGELNEEERATLAEAIRERVRSGERPRREG